MYSAIFKKVCTFYFKGIELQQTKETFTITAADTLGRTSSKLALYALILMGTRVRVLLILRVNWYQFMLMLNS